MRTSTDTALPHVILATAALAAAYGSAALGWPFIAVALFLPIGLGQAKRAVILDLIAAGRWVYGRVLITAGRAAAALRRWWARSSGDWPGGGHHRRPRYRREKRQRHTSHEIISR